MTVEGPETRESFVVGLIRVDICHELHDGEDVFTAGFLSDTDSGPPVRIEERLLEDFAAAAMAAHLLVLHMHGQTSFIELTKTLDRLGISIDG